MLISLFYFHFSQVSGQGLVKSWDKIYSGNVYESFTRVLETSDHGLLVAGSSNSGIGGDKTQDNHDTGYVTFDFWIVKTDSNGNLQWERTFGGSLMEELLDARETADHGFILAGTTMSDSSGDVSEATRGIKDYWIVKTDSAGNKLWDKRFGGNQTDLLTCVTQTSDGGYLLGGSSLSNAGGDKSDDNHNSNNLNFDFWIIKTDASGNKLWDKTIGGDNTDMMQAVIALSSGDLLLGGYSKSPASGDKTGYCRGEADYWLLRTDPGGIIVWEQTYGGDNIDWMFGMTLAADGGIVMAGTSGSTDSIGERTAPTRGYWDFWTLKADSNGVKLWDQAYGGTDAEEVSQVIRTQDDGFLISGTSYSNTGGEKSEDNLGLEQGWLVKTDANGVLQWDRTVFTYGHDETGYAIQTHEGCYVAGVYTEADTGGYKSWHNLSASDYWILKFCYEAPLVSFASSDTVFCAKKCLDFYDLSTNNPTNWYWSFPGAVPSFSTVQNPTNICYNAYGTFDVTLVASNPYGSDSLTVTDFIIEYLLPPPVVTFSDDTLFCSPAYTYQWYLDTVPIPGATGSFVVMDQPGSYSVRITDSLGCMESSQLFTTGLEEANSDLLCSVYPNPVSDDFFICTGSDQGMRLHMELFNVHSIRILQQDWSLVPGINCLRVDTRGMAPGVYFLELHSGGRSFRKKIIIR